MRDSCPRLLAFVLSTLTALMTFADPASGQVRIDLAPAATQPGATRPAPGPYLPARLTVAAPPEGPPVQAVRLREVQGGPTILLPLTVPPGTTRSATIVLPAWSQQQSYRAALLADDRADAAEISWAHVNLAWPSDAASRDALFDAQAYEEHPRPAQWDAALVRNLFLLLVAFALACGAALLVHCPPARAGLLLVLVAAAAGGAWLLVRDQGLVVQRELDRDAFRLLVLTTRRTTVWEAPRPLWPVYFSPRQMRDDDLVIHVGRSTRLTLRPDDVRILRDVRTSNR